VSNILIMMAIFVSVNTAFAQENIEKKANQIMQIQCGTCHLSSKPSVVHAALKVFNLDDRYWAHNLLD